MWSHLRALGVRGYHATPIPRHVREGAGPRGGCELVGTPLQSREDRVETPERDPACHRDRKGANAKVRLHAGTWQQARCAPLVRFVDQGQRRD